MTYDIVTYGCPVLRKKAVLVQMITQEIRQLAADMLESMYASKGLGLAAEQIGATWAVCVIDVPTPQEPEHPDHANDGIPMPLVMINPEISEHEGEQVGQEGCLSFPEIFVTVKRHWRVTCRYMDLDGNLQTVNAVGLLSRAIQHELDHLNGVLLVDRMGPVQKVAHSGQLKRLKASSTGG